MPVKRQRYSSERIDFAGAMRFGSKEAAERLDLMVDFSGIRNICDLGCGPGTICMELLQTHSHLRAVLIDNDEEAVKIAKSQAQSLNLQDRVSVLKKDILDADIDQSFDMIIMSLVLCLLTRNDATCLLNKAKMMLRPGGTLLLGEVLLASSRNSPTTATLFAVHLMVSGAMGGLFSLDEICGMLIDCGIKYQRHFPTNLYDIIVARNELD
jgi:SAM-dependent methyltransferase